MYLALEAPCIQGLRGQRPYPIRVITGVRTVSPASLCGSTQVKPRLLPSSPIASLPFTTKQGIRVDSSRATRRRCKTKCRGSLQAAAAASDEVTVEFRVPQYVTALGQELRVAGESTALGAWDINSAPAMTWQEGHAWVLSVRLPVGQHAFKLAVVTGRNAVWETGEDRQLLIKHGEKLLGPEAKVTVTCEFNLTASTKMETKYDKSFLQARLSKAQKMVVSLTQRKLLLQKQLVTLLHQAQDSERTTKQLAVEVMAASADHPALAQLPGSRTSSGSGPSLPKGRHSEGQQQQQVHQPPPALNFNSLDDASEAEMEPLDTEVMQRALSSSLQQLTTDAPTEEAHSTSETPAVSSHVEFQCTSDGVAAVPEAAASSPLHDSCPSDDPDNVFQTIDVHRGLVPAVQPSWYAASLTASMHDELLYGFLSMNFGSVSATATEQVEGFASQPSDNNAEVLKSEVKSHAVSFTEADLEESLISAHPITIDEPADIEEPSSATATMAIEQPAPLELPQQTRSSDPQPGLATADVALLEDQKMWKDIMGMLVHSHFWHMLRLSSSVGKPQLLLLQLSVAITAAAVGRTPGSIAPAASKRASQGLLSSLRKAWAPVSALTRRIFPVTTAALVGALAVGWYARVASAGVN